LHSLWLSGALGVISSMYGCIYRAKRTLLLLFDLLVLTPAFLLVLTIMRANFSFDVEGRIIPHTPEDAVHPHWASVAQVVSWDLRFLASNIILSHTLVFSSSTVKTALPSSSSQLSLGQTIARRKAFDWIIPVMFCFVAWLVRKSYTPMMVQGPDVPQRLLLHVQAILGTSWPIQTAAVVLMVMSLMLVIKSKALRHVDPRKRWLVRRLLKSSSPSTGSDDAPPEAATSSIPASEVDWHDTGKPMTIVAPASSEVAAEEMVLPMAVPGEVEASNEDLDDDAERQRVMDGLCASTRPHQEAQGYTNYASPPATSAPSGICTASGYTSQSADSDGSMSSGEDFHSAPSGVPTATDCSEGSDEDFRSVLSGVSTASNASMRYSDLGSYMHGDDLGHSAPPSDSSSLVNAARQMLRGFQQSARQNATHPSSRDCSRAETVDME